MFAKKEFGVRLDDKVEQSISDMSPRSLSVRDIYFRLCACLDREIELVWKRAVFLTAFLIAAFTAYGGLIATYLGSEHKQPSDFAVVSIAAIGIAFIGMALSVIWIMMAKGSKAWQEHYENVIECFVANHKSDDELQNICASGNYLQERPEPIIKRFNLKRKDILVGLFNCAGGPYSVSKIVIVIGQGSLVLWGVIFSLHTVYLGGHFGKVCEDVSTFIGDVGGVRISLVVLAAFFALAILIRNFVFKPTFCSDYLKDLAKMADKEEKNEVRV